MAVPRTIEAQVKREHYGGRPQQQAKKPIKKVQIYEHKHLTQQCLSCFVSDFDFVIVLFCFVLLF